MKNTKRCFVLFSFYDRTGIEAYLEKQAEKGWMAIKFLLLYNWCKSALLDDPAHNYGRPVPEDEMWQEHIEIDAAPWGANEAYQLKLGGELQMRFLLCYDYNIVEIDFDHDWKLTAEQMAIVGEKLNEKN